MVEASFPVVEVVLELVDSVGVLDAEESDTVWLPLVDEVSWDASDEVVEVVVVDEASVAGVTVVDDVYSTGVPDELVDDSLEDVEEASEDVELSAGVSADTVDAVD